MSIITALIAFLKGIPALAKLGETLANLFREYSARNREAEATRRKAEKDSAVDRAVDDAVHGMRNGSTEQQQPPDRPS